MALKAEEVVAIAMSRLAAITKLRPSHLIGLSTTEEGWKVSIEMIEKKSIPESLDILATYEIILNESGDLKSFQRTALRKRMDTEV